MDESEYSDVIRIPPAELKKIIEQCIGAGRAKRIQYNSIGLTVMHPGGTQARFQVHTLDLSATGLGFLHGGYLHKGSKCSIVLKGVGDTSLKVTGQITNCLHITGCVHRVGMKFDRPADIERLLGTHNEDGSLAGRLLFIEQSEPERGLMKHELRGTNIEVIGFAAPVKATSYLRSHPVERVLSDIATIEDSVTETILSIRKVGYRGPILLTTTDQRSPALSEAKELGAGPALNKPFDPSELILFLSENWVDQDEDDQDADAPDSGLLRLLESYITQVHNLTRELDAATLSADYRLTLGVCHRFKGSGAPFGFSDITQAASEAITALHAGGSIPDASAELRKLREVCARIDLSQSDLLVP